MIGRIGYEEMRAAGEIRGERIYTETLPLAHRLFLTAIEVEVDGDTRFPEWSHLFSRRLWHQPGTGGGFSFDFQVWERPLPQI